MVGLAVNRRSVRRHAVPAAGVRAGGGVRADGGGAAKVTFVIGLVCLTAAVGLAARSNLVADEGGLTGTLPSSTVPAAAQARHLAVPPRTVRIPALKVSAPVEPVAVERNGDLTIPSRPDRIGWWIGGAALGSATGTVLLAGHVDAADAGPGALYRLEKLAMGSVVEVDSADLRYSYRVVARRVYRKTDLPDNLFDRGGRPTLALVTCGGSFEAGRGYERNVVVYAEPTGQPRRLR